MKILFKLLLVVLVSANTPTLLAHEKPECLCSEKDGRAKLVLELDQERNTVKELLTRVKKAHPEVQRRYQRIAELEKEISASEKEKKKSELLQARKDLASMLGMMKESHPAVREQQRKVRLLEESIEDGESPAKVET